MTSPLAYAGLISSPLLYDAVASASGYLMNNHTYKAARVPAPGWLPDHRLMPKWDTEVRNLLYLFEFFGGLSLQGGDRPKEDESTGARPHYNTAAATLLCNGDEIHAMPAPRPDIFDAELRAVISNRAERRDRMPEILTQVAVQTPFYAMCLNLNPGRHRHVFELVGTLFLIGKAIVMQFKHHFHVPRPADLASHVFPVLQTPGHGSYPAGHATETHMMSAVLLALAKVSGRYSSAALSELEVQLFDLATRISDNRIIAGLHYPMDNDAGSALGRSIADLVLYRANLADWGAKPRTWPKVQPLPKLQWLTGMAIEELRQP